MYVRKRIQANLQLQSDHGHRGNKLQKMTSEEKRDEKIPFFLKNYVGAENIRSISSVLFIVR